MLRSTLAAAALVAMIADASSAAEHKIMVALWTGCDEVCEGIKAGLSEAGIDVELLIRDANRDKTVLPVLRAEARDAKVDLVLTYGTSVTKGVAGTLDDLADASFNQDIPHVFTMVANPVGSRIVESLDHTGRPNVTGTYNRVPEDVNIQSIRAYMPGFHHLGLLYNANEQNSVLKRDELAALASGGDFQLTAVALPLDAEGKPRVEDIPAGIAELKAAGVEFIYLGSSSFLDANRDAFTGAAVASGLPVLSPYEPLVRESQALMSVAARDYDVGHLAAEQAVKILTGGAKPGDLPVARITDFAIVINMGVAKKLNLFPPLELLQVAETVN